MKRRDFLRSTGIIFLGLISASKIKAENVIDNISKFSNEFIGRITKIITELKFESTNLVKKIMNGRKYEYDPFTHYPYDGGIKDEKTGYQIFFHIHRENEYGHFHTFATDEKGDLVHLVLISMSENGKPIGLATVNRWVTGGKFVKSEVLKSLATDFYIDPNLYSDIRVIEFINNVFKGYAREIDILFDERDVWIKNYVNHNFNEPFEDCEHEITSYKEIQIKL